VPTGGLCSTEGSAKEISQDAQTQTERGPTRKGTRTKEQFPEKKGKKIGGGREQKDSRGLKFQGCRVIEKKGGAKKGLLPRAKRLHCA